MDHEHAPDADMQEIRQAAEAVEKLAGNSAAFNEAHAAFMASDAARFEAALNQAGIPEFCHLVCKFFCEKHCLGLCRKFCPRPHTGEVDREEIFAFAKAVAPLLRDEALVKRFLEIVTAENVEAWNEEIKKRHLEAYCYQLCV